VPGTARHEVVCRRQGGWIPPAADPEAPEDPATPPKRPRTRSPAPAPKRSPRPAASPHPAGSAASTGRTSSQAGIRKCGVLAFMKGARCPNYGLHRVKGKAADRLQIPSGRLADRGRAKLSKGGIGVCSAHTALAVKFGFRPKNAEAEVEAECESGSGEEEEDEEETGTEAELEVTPPKKKRRLTGGALAALATQSSHGGAVSSSQVAAADRVAREARHRRMEPPPPRRPLPAVQVAGPVGPPPPPGQLLEGLAAALAEAWPRYAAKQAAEMRARYSPAHPIVRVEGIAPIGRSPAAGRALFPLCMVLFNVNVLGTSRGTQGTFFLIPFVFQELT